MAIQELWDINGLPGCPRCLRLTPKVEKNAGGRFRVQCQKCGMGTAWESKTQALIDWGRLCCEKLYDRRDELLQQLDKEISENIRLKDRLSKYEIV